MWDESLAGTPAEPEAFDTLFLRDGSVLQGLIVKDSRGRYHIDHPILGDLSVGEEAVVYLLPKQEGEAWMTETHVIVRETLGVISVLSRAIPERNGESARFNLLVPGRVDSINDRSGSTVPFRSREMGGLTIVTIEYADVSAPAKGLLITSRQTGLLRTTGTGEIEFQAKRVFNESTNIRMVLEHPAGWKVSGVSPEPAHGFGGLIVWEKGLKRQQTFLPTVTFQPETD